MANYLLVTSDALANIQTINAAQAAGHNQVSPVTLVDGRMILNADMLTDTVTWANWMSILSTLAPTTVVQSDFVVPNLPGFA